MSQQTAAKWLDLLDRGGWTFVQALAGFIVAGASTNSSFATFNWPSALLGAAAATALSVLKVLGVNASTSISGFVALGTAVADYENTQTVPSAAERVASRHELRP